MSGTTLNAGDLTARQRQILFRAWHRGMREMDLLMGAFADAVLTTMPEEELAEFEKILMYPDADLFKWFKGDEIIPEEYDSPVLRRFLAFRLT
ncbi:MAG: succinate dehydrogenase assembly factor 2 [Methylobacteriaceae bacterium]|jgi:antitoxin CptB|nr:succinate dehydrogenase assembly factor 2 [Methylobacteriaceae bacterium]